MQMVCSCHKTHMKTWISHSQRMRSIEEVVLSHWATLTQRHGTQEAGRFWIPQSQRMRTTLADRPRAGSDRRKPAYQQEHCRTCTQYRLKNPRSNREPHPCQHRKRGALHEAKVTSKAQKTHHSLMISHVKTVRHRINQAGRAHRARNKQRPQSHSIKARTQTGTMHAAVWPQTENSKKGSVPWSVPLLHGIRVHPVLFCERALVVEISWICYVETELNHKITPRRTKKKKITLFTC